MRTRRPKSTLAVVTAFALLLLLGPLGLLQIVAWTGMAFDYSARYGLTSGLQRTFDGEHPCTLCQKITEVRKEQSESRTSTALAPVKMVWLPAPTAVAPPSILQTEAHEFFLHPDFLTSRSEAPPSPPPRTLAA